MSYAIAGELCRRGFRSVGFFNVTTFSTYLRPSSAMPLKTTDLISPPPECGGRSKFGRCSWHRRSATMQPRPGITTCQWYSTTRESRASESCCSSKQRCSFAWQMSRQATTRGRKRCGSSDQRHTSRSGRPRSGARPPRRLPDALPGPERRAVTRPPGQMLHGGRSGGPRMVEGSRLCPELRETITHKKGQSGGWRPDTRVRRVCAAYFRSMYP